MIQVKGPDGAIVQFPDGTDQGVMEKALQEHYADFGKSAAPQTVNTADKTNIDGPSWADLPGNIIPSAEKFGAGLFNAATHPGDTLEGAGRAAAGGLLNAASYVAPDMVAAHAAAVPEDAKSMQVASALGKALLDRYGGLDAIKQTMIKDPAGFAADASTLLTGIGGGIRAVAADGSRLADVGNFITKAGDATNPLSVVTNPVALAAKSKVGTTLGDAAAEALALPSGAGGQSIAEAFRSGRAGGSRAEAFRDNMRGVASQDEVLSDAHTALGNLADERAAAYKSGMAATKANPAQLPYAPIEQAMQDTVDSLFHGPVQKTDDASLNLAKKVGNTIDAWKTNYPNPTAFDLDQLKIAIDKLKPNFSQTSGDQGRIVTTMRNAVKDQILQADPTYAKTMKDYSSSKELQGDIESALSLNGKASKDTALRKLQSVTRNNANTNYGSRVQNAKTLEDYGATNLLSKLAGQQMSSLAPRGLSRLLASGEAAYAFSHPTNALSTIAAMLASSPRVVGEVAHAGGRVARRVPARNVSRALTAGTNSQALIQGPGN